MLADDHPVVRRRRRPAMARIEAAGLVGTISLRAGFHVGLPVLAEDAPSTPPTSPLARYVQTTSRAFGNETLLGALHAGGCHGCARRTGSRSHGYRANKRTAD